MDASNTNILLGKICASIGKGYDLTQGNSFICTSNIVRIVAKEDSQIKSSKFNEDTIGLLLPEGAIEYFKVDIDDTISVISGSVNISSTN